ncbi:MAG TPA: TRAP transporter small permease subunit [Polyangiaceae bacterium]|nr:TRAP transporter small permease subunit [Polyangiaceae bacterium]
MVAPDGTGEKASAGAERIGLVRFDDAWQMIESRLCAGVLVAEVASLTIWISLKGLSTDWTPGVNAAGLVYRSLLSASALGLAAHLAARRRGVGAHRAAVASAVALGLAGGRLWAHAGVGWSSNALNWLQNASALMLVGGLRGLATRLTLWLALLGASLATSRGKHIHIDIAARLLPPALRARAAVAGWLAASFVCVVAVVGFLDYISIAEFRADAVAPCPGDPARTCDAPASRKAAAVARVVSSDLFLLGRQLSLDGRSLPRVLAGRAYDKWMTAAEWNAWLDGADWAAHFGSAADALRMDPAAPDALRMPQVTVPGTGEEARGLLIRELNFVFPFGLAIIAVKFALRALALAITGRLPDVETPA